MDAQGVFYQMPKSSDGDPLPPRSVTLFNDSYSKDKFENTAFGLSTASRPPQAVYTGAYLIRKMRQYRTTRTTRVGKYADYYQFMARSLRTPGLTCFSPSTSERVRAQLPPESRNPPEHAHDWRLRGILAVLGKKWRSRPSNWLYKTCGRVPIRHEGCLTMSVSRRARP